MTKTAAEIAARWATSYPLLRERVARAVPLVPGVRQYRWDEYTVPSSRGGSYIVRVRDVGGRRESTCTCEDHRRGHHCKHRLAAAIWVRERWLSRTAAC